MGRVWRSNRHDGVCRDDACPGDERLVDGLRRRSPDALACLHEEYAAGIFSLAMRVVRHAPDAEDITQDVLLRAFERLPRDGEVLLRPWLYRLTLNRCYDHLRWTARRPLAPPDREVASPRDPFEQSELQRLLEESLGDLTRRQRAALLLKDVHGLSLVEVAACLDLTPGSVEVLLARARRAFRASFEMHCAAVGRPLPRSTVGLVGLPLLPLPPGLAASMPLPVAALPAPGVALPLAGPSLAATGGGIGALLGLPASVKTAVLIAAAAATMGSAEVAVTHADRRPPLASPMVATVTTGAAVSAAPAVSAHVRHAAAAKPAARRSSSPAPTAQPLVSASPTEVAEPQPQGSPLGVATPSAASEASASPSAQPTPTARASTDPLPSVSPSASATPSPEASTSPSPSAIP